VVSAIRNNTPVPDAKLNVCFAKSRSCTRSDNVGFGRDRPAQSRISGPLQRSTNMEWC
jgi:hypothetical protein